MKQWVMRITDYADRLLEDLETLIGLSQSNHLKEIGSENQKVLKLVFK